MPGETVDDTLRRLLDLPKLPARPKHSPFKHPIRDMQVGDQHVMKVKVYDRSNKQDVDHEVLKHKRYVFRVTKGTGKKFHMVFMGAPEVFGVVVTRVI